jgi:hypothetical protein
MEAPAKKVLTPEEINKRARSILFKPCKTKEALSKWIYFFLDLEMPDCIVDPDSNCSPMDMIWETYSKALNNNDPNFSRVLYYASRSSYKTLGAAVLEILLGMHLGHDVGHLAALKEQSIVAQRYVKRFFNFPYLRDFKTGDNLDEVFIEKYTHEKTGDVLTIKEWRELLPAQQGLYKYHKSIIKIIICTIRGVNSFHCPLLICDEIDVVADNRAYEDAKMIPSPMGGRLPITLLTSTRKISTGLVQKEIDKAVDNDGTVRLHIRHWNLIDVTEKCPPERCLPHLPKIPIYVNEDQLDAISETKYELLPDDVKDKFIKHEGFQGCLSNCKLFAACKTRLYTIQKSKSRLLRQIDHTINQFRDVTLDNAKAQLLCRQPSSEGKIYPSLDRTIHLKTAAQMAEMLLGMPVDPNFTKKQLIALIKERDDWGFYTGMDFGFTHNFAVTTGAADGYRMFILDAFCIPNLLPDAIVNTCNKRLKYLNPAIYADPESPMLVAMLKQEGFRMKKWKKGPGSLLGGMDVVKLKLREPMGDPTLFFLAGDPGVEELFKQMGQYHWKTDPNGDMSDVPDEKDDDGPDSCRYLVMNKFSSIKSGSISASSQNRIEDEKPLINPNIWTKDTFFSKAFELHGVGTEPGTDYNGSEAGVKWSF